MSPSAPSQNGTDAVLAEVVEEFTNRVQAGEPVDVESHVGRHPEYAERLRQLLPALALLADLSRSASPLADDAEAESRQGALAGVLGDFRIRREVGRGGMGVVYEAEQISLRRRVALKVLPLAATLDPRHLQRFHNEAQAAACLHHTNIVPVFSVGCERGVHFYAMQFIDGQPLSELIRQLLAAEKKTPEAAGEERTVVYQIALDDAAPTPPAAERTPLTGEGRRGRDYYRKVAELGVQAAEALDHAHQLGIVHRDIKPGNLLLDGRGNLWVMDFGLAHVRQSAANLTTTGQAVGTPRYMSPEQALAKRVPIDHRTDVYSLGATLYELLTLRPAFGSEDRQELMRQIAFEDPARPRRLERAIPAELEIIVLKAMEKRPQDRYATAQELADDLRRWLLDQPILARRPSWLQVGRKWARRHQSVVWSAALVLLVLLVLGAGNGLWWLRKQTAAETEARAALEEAERWQQEEKWSEALSAIRRAHGVLSGFGADADLQRLIDRRGKDVEMAQRLEVARLQMTDVKEEHFDSQGFIAAYAAAFQWYGLDVEHLNPVEAGEAIQSRSIQRQLVAALDHWALLRGKPNTSDKIKMHLLAVARAADPSPWHNRLCDVLEGKGPKALEALMASDPTEELPPAAAALLPILIVETPEAEQVVRFLRRLQQRYPNDFWLNHELAYYLHHHARPRRLEEAVGLYMAAVALRPQSPGVDINLGRVLEDKGQVDEAIAEYRQAIRLKKDYAAAHNNLGDTLKNQGQLDEAIAEYREAIRLKFDGIIVGIHGSLGEALAKKGQLDEAIAEFREVIRVNKVSPEAYKAHGSIGNALAQKGQLDAAIAECREAIRLNKDGFEAHNNLGFALWRKGQLDEAIVEYREAIRLNKDDSSAHSNLGGALFQKGQVDEAIAACREAIRLNKDDYVAHCNLGVALLQKGQLDAAIAEYREAIRIKKDYAEAHCNLGQVLVQKGQFAEALPHLRRGHELGSRNPRWPYPSAQWIRNCERLVELDSKLSAILSGSQQPADSAERLALAQLCQLPFKKQYLVAKRFYAAAFAQEPKLANDLNAQYRYDAACAAALAGCGQGQDADKLDRKERARLRQQALDWLRADLKAYHQLMEKSAGKADPAIAPRMQHWLQDDDFASVRGGKALAKLPEAERSEWRKLWQEVETLRKRAVERH